MNDTTKKTNKTCKNKQFFHFLSYVFHNLDKPVASSKCLLLPLF